MKEDNQISNFNINARSSLNQEELPMMLIVKFEEIKTQDFPKVIITIDGQQFGDIIDDNSYSNDGYRFHDVFHYTFACLLDWSPCVRSMLKRKRKSNSTLDRIEDGARAIITEESISLLIFNEAQKNFFFEGALNINDDLLSMIKSMTNTFEVSKQSKKKWEQSILKGYEMFRLLLHNHGGIITFNSRKKKISYLPLT